jgi:hypothetical protein
VVDAEVGVEGGAGAQARKRTPPTCSWAVPVGRMGSSMPFTSTWWRSGSRPSARTSTRSTEEST